MKTATLDRSMEPTTATSAATATAPALRPSGPTNTSTRKTAVLVGLLFLVATVTFSTADRLIAGVLTRPDYLAGASAHTTALAIGALLALIEGPATVVIGCLLYPLLKRQSEPLARAFVGFRVAEVAVALVYVAAPLLVIRVASGVHDGAIDATAAHQLGALFQAQRSVAVLMIYLLTSLGGAILALLLYRSRLVPRSIAVLGVVGYPVLLAGTILAMFNVTDVTKGVGVLALVPGGLFELILPIWLLAKGFTDAGAES